MTEPYILAIDTSTDQMTVAISCGKKILSEQSSPERHHTKKLIQTIDGCLKNSNLELKNLDAFACTTGPGSFTGVRTAVGTVKGLAYATSKPLIGIPTLYAMAYPCLEYDQVAPVLEARNGFVYTAIFKKSATQWTETNSAQMLSVEEYIKIAASNSVIVGNSIQKYFKKSGLTFPDSLKSGNSKFDTICATTLCEIAFHKFVTREFENVFSLEPLYIQKTAAEGYV